MFILSYNDINIFLKIFEFKLLVVWDASWLLAHKIKRKIKRNKLMPNIIAL